MIHKHRILSMAGVLAILFATIAWFACAGSKAAQFGNAKDGYILSYRAKPGDLMIYKSVRHGVTTSERDGQTRESNDDMNGVYNLVAEKSDTVLSFVFRIDTLDQIFTFGGEKRPMPDDRMVGIRHRLIITPTGVQRAFTPIDSLPKPAPGEGRPPGGPRMRGGRRGGPGGGPGGYLSFFVLPTKPVKIGDNWTETRHDSTTDADTTRGFTLTNITDSKITYTILAEEIRNGIPCLHIKRVNKYSSQSYGKMMDSDMTSEGDGENIADVWFAHTRGVLVEMTEGMFYEGSRAFSGGAGSQTTESKTTLSLVKHVPK
jgi:hypothetical protein